MGQTSNVMEVAVRTVGTRVKLPSVHRVKKVVCPKQSQKIMCSSTIIARNIIQTASETVLGTFFMK